MKRLVKYSIEVWIGVIVGACSNVPSLPTQSTSLATQACGEQYYFCESCNTPTELSTQIYKPLEPDTIITPIIEPITHISKPLQQNKKRSYKTKQHKQRTAKKSKIKQCIKWSK